MDEEDKNGTENKDASKKIHKQPRKRTKRILNLIQNQVTACFEIVEENVNLLAKLQKKIEVSRLEFYFGDANLRHDRFLRKEIEQNEGYVDLTKMLKFNKLKSLTTDICMLAKAVENSQLLTLNEDRTKLRRHAKLPDQVNTDSNTVYVEQLPAYVDHNWLKQVFSTCGKVEYISLPRYKHNNHIKGFAFIEFSNGQEAEKACQVLNTALPYKSKSRKRQSTEKNVESQNGEPNKVGKRKRSVSFSGESDSDGSQQERCKRRRSNSSTSEQCNTDETNTQSKCTTVMEPLSFKATDKLKRKSQASSDNGVSTQKRKHCEATESTGKDSVDCDFSKKKIKTIDSVTHAQDGIPIVQSSETKQSERKDDTSKESGDDIKNPDQNKKKKNRKRNHHKRNSEPNVINCPPLYVISKNEWLNLKKQFKNLKRKELSHLKRTVRILKSEKVRQSEMKERILETMEAKQKKKNDKENIDYNSTLQPVVCSNEQASEKSTDYQLPSGTVCRLTSSSDVLTRKEVRSTLSQTCDVSYVDFIDGSDKGFVRFPCKEARDTAIACCSTSWNFQITKLGEEEEENYFHKVEEDRRKKYNGVDKIKKTSKKRRGTEKILRAAEKLSEHIRFET